MKLKMANKKFCDKCKQDMTNEKNIKVTIRQNLLSFQQKELCIKCSKLLEDWFHQ